METRGRKPHPDVLTPRQWEVLDLLRRGWTDTRIAEHLGISLDGAKYHVSEILSRLGVASRQEAARWRTNTRSRWWRALVWAPALASIAGLAILTVAAIEVAIQTSSEEVPRVSMSEDEAVTIATAAAHEDVTEGQYDFVSAELSTYGEVFQPLIAAQEEGVAFSEFDYLHGRLEGVSDSLPVWWVTFQGLVLLGDPTTSPVTCSERRVMIEASTGEPVMETTQTVEPPGLPACDGYAGRGTSEVAIEAVMGPYWVSPHPPDETLTEKMSYAEAVARMGASPESGIDPESGVWLVTLRDNPPVWDGSESGSSVTTCDLVGMVGVWEGNLIAADWFPAICR